MPGYRICSLDEDGLIRHIRSESFENDEAAMAVAADMAERFAAVEVWNSGRLIRHLRGGVRPSDGPGQTGGDQSAPHTAADSVAAGGDNSFRVGVGSFRLAARRTPRSRWSARLPGYRRGLGRAPAAHQA